jgi:hypothetical protein
MNTGRGTSQVTTIRTGHPSKLKSVNIANPTDVNLCSGTLFSPSLLLQARCSAT